jgi:hypothetical protein
MAACLLSPKKLFKVFVPLLFPRFQHKLTERCEFKVKVFYTLFATSIIQSLKSDNGLRGTSFAQLVAGTAPIRCRSWQNHVALMEPAEQAIRK